MYDNLSDPRKPLSNGSRVRTGEIAYVIDRYIGSGGSCLMYLAHQEGSTRYVALKELFPHKVAGGVAERRSDDVIVIYDPATQTSADDKPEVWAELTSDLQREVDLTVKASRVYDRTGKQELQNSPDVLQVSAPFQDERGNRYVAIDTVQGESLREWVTQGVLKDENGNVIGNGRMRDILVVIEETAKLLDHLHGDSHMLHLDLSPDNIWLSNSLGGTRVTPHIIDYGSAYDLDDPEEKTDHRFTCNPWASPEVMALAELNDQDAGYEVDASSDTYAVVSILFWAITGQHFTTSQRYSQSWRDMIMEEYGPGSRTDGTSFAERLLALLEKGLSVDQSERYRTAAELLTDLKALRGQYKSFGSLLPDMEEDELMCWVLLDRYPLYEYRSANGDMDVLCLGSGRFVQRMILTTMSAGQMIKSKLRIHVVSHDSVDEVRSMLLNKAPALEGYSNISGPLKNPKLEYVSFTFAQVDDLLDPETCARIAKEYSFCRYMVISLGRNNHNIDLARLYGKELSSLDPPEKSVIHYYMSEDAAGNVRSDVSDEGISSKVELVPFGSDVAACAAAVRDLGRLSLRMQYLYDKLSNPRQSLAASMAYFLTVTQREYNQRSSCASAVHLRYKLNSVGVSTSSRTNHKSIVAGYQKALDTRMGELLELEHRRWLIYMVADGYRFPTMDQIKGYAFRPTNSQSKAIKNGFIDAFKNIDENVKLHHCLVPCGTGGVCLPREQAEWDKFSSDEEIDATNYDDLDRMSLKVHLLARRRVENAATGNELRADYHNKIGKRMTDWAEALRNSAARESDPEVAQGVEDRIRQLEEQYGEMDLALDNLIEYHLYTDEIDRMKALKTAFEKEGIDAEFQTVINQLAIYKEFSAYKDYKAPDQTIISNALWLLYGGEPLTLVKLAGRSVLSNIAAPIIMDPKNLIYFGLEYDENLRTFLRGHGCQGEISFQPCDATGGEDIYRVLERLRAGITGRVALDITDTSEVMAVAAGRLAQNVRNTGLIRNVEGSVRLENVSGFSLAGIYRLNNNITAAEVYQLYGAQERLQEDKGYMERLDQVAEQMWGFYQLHRADWEQICLFFTVRGTGSSEIHMRLNPELNSWSTFSRMFPTIGWEQYRLKQCFETLQREGLIRNLSAKPRKDVYMDVSFEYPGSAYDRGSGKPLDDYFRYQKLACALQPYSIVIGGDGPEKTVDISSGSMVDIYDGNLLLTDNGRPQKTAQGKNIPYASMLPILRELESMGLISNLSLSAPNVAPVNIHFAYSNLSIKNALTKSGNILELYIWHCAHSTKWFDDCRPNLSFDWKEGISNELDLILTKGLTTVVVSCKTGKYNKEHLYEIRYLTDRFSLNSKAVIVYSSNTKVDDLKQANTIKGVVERARAMGIYLLDTNEMSASEIGQALVEIAKGTRKP